MLKNIEDVSFIKYSLMLFERNWMIDVFPD